MHGSNTRRRLADTDDTGPKHNPRAQTFSERGEGHMPQWAHMVSHTQTDHGDSRNAKFIDDVLPVHVPAECDGVAV